MWNPDLLIDYYKNNIRRKISIPSTKVAILLGYLHMLRPQKAC
jgi:hypothetical protein